MMQKICSRRFDVDFFEKDEATWLVVTHLVDDAHDITTKVEVRVPDMAISAADVEFARYPLDVCPRIERNVKRIVGLNLLKNYNMKSLTIFLGSKGCGNVMQILSAGLQAFVYAYYPYLVKTGKMSAAEWEKFSITRLRKACLGHTLLERGQARPLLHEGAPA
jgi:Protein of unknown function (DUF2889)